MLWTLISVALGCSCPSVTVQETTSSFDAARVDESSRGWFQALDNPKPLRAQQAMDRQVYSADEHMMMVTTDKETRLYPVSGIAWHHVVNDVVGGVPVAVTFEASVILGPHSSPRWVAGGCSLTK